MRQDRFTIHLKPEVEGGFTVTVPALPGCVTFGATIEEAKTMAIDAIKGYLMSAEKHGDAIVGDNDALMMTVDVVDDV